MNELFNAVMADLQATWNAGRVSGAQALNQNLGNQYFSEVAQPMYFVGKPEAKTVMVMLNPGGDGPPFIQQARQRFQNFDAYYQDFIDRHKNYGDHDANRPDPFDYKAAVFLSPVPSDVLGFKFDPQFVANVANATPAIKLEAKRIALMEKLQLELVPYQSRTFPQLFGSVNSAAAVLPVVQNHFVRLLDAIAMHTRQYVVFASAQFSNIFEAIDRGAVNIPGLTRLVLGDIITYQIDHLENRVRYHKLNFTYKGIEIKALIANSFARRDLPFAYNQMRDYGQLCYQLWAG